MSALSMERHESIAMRLAAAREQVEVARTASGLSHDVTIVAVTKTVPADVILKAYAAGQQVFGENRVQEGLEKIRTLEADASEARWHMIGHLQRNKAKAATGAFSVIESVDSLRLAGVLSAYAKEAGRRLPILLEVNVGREEAKSGYVPEALEADFAELAALPGIAATGLMTVAPMASDAEDVRWVFRGLRELRDRLRERYDCPELAELSMGMSGDFRVAIQEGATMVRLGRAIFGERPVHLGNRVIR